MNIAFTTRKYVTVTRGGEISVDMVAFVEKAHPDLSEANDMFQVTGLCGTLSGFALHTHLGLQTFNIPVY